MNIILFGAPGAGKGTQSSFLTEKKEMLQISTGDLFRAAIKNKTELGKKAQEYMDKGQLVPDTVTIAMVEEVLKSSTKDFILDGFPRNVAQANALNELLKKLNLSLGKAIFLEVPMAILEDRLTGRRVCKSCGTVYHISSKPTQRSHICDNCGGEVVQRNDDKADVISTRLKTYEEYTSPLKDYYKGLGKFVSVDGNRDPKVVFGDILEELK